MKWFLTLLLLVSSAHALSMLDLAPQGFVYVADQRTAQEALQTARQSIDVMESANLSTTFVGDAYAEAQRALAGDVELVLKLSQLIVYVQREAQLLSDELAVLQRELSGDTAHAFYQTAVVALNEGRYDDCRAALDRARMELQEARAAQSRSELIGQVQQWFFLRYKWHIAATAMTGIAVGIPFARSYKTRRLRSKLLRLREDRLRTEALIVDLQKRCFIEKKMMPSTYRQKAVQYEEHLADIKRTLPVLEAQLEGEKQ